MHYEQMLRNIDGKIDELVRSEARKLTTSGQNDLHLLLENCKDIRKYMQATHSEKASKGLDEESILKFKGEVEYGG